ncbi:MAG TPA: tRNA lysidine(34) synthetase TilS [Thermomicrobiales bacterium]|nr:tRNA lysidine(34) synthetase TilS [Thermomicrobiales bacterium]
MNRRFHDDQSRAPEFLRGESGLIQRVRRFLRDHFRGEAPHLVVGYSGGQDSLALLLVLGELERLGACRVTAAHVDHGLRPEAAQDAERVVEIGCALGVDVRVYRPETPLREQYRGRSVEDAARVFRYRTLASVVSTVNADAIAVAHHARDQAETVLLHVLRGSGLAGLSGMAADKVLPVPGSMSGVEMRVIRPFLHESPETLVELVERSGLPIIEDPSNTSPDFRRNRIRHALLPLMEDIAPGATGRLVSLADILRADEEALDDVSHLLLHRTTDDASRLVWDPIQGAPVGLQRRVVRHWILQSGFSGDLSRERIEAVVELTRRNEGGKQIEIGGGWSVRYAEGRLELRGRSH